MAIIVYIEFACQPCSLAIGHAAGGGSGHETIHKSRQFEKLAALDHAQLWPGTFVIKLKN